MQKQEGIFKRWMQQYQGLFFKLMRTYAFNEADREDLLQEMAIQLWRSIPSFQQQSSELTWVYRVCLNTALNWSRKEKRHQQGREDWQPTLVMREEGNHIFDERLAWLYEQIARLHALDRSLCLLMLDGFRYKEIAQILGISESQVGVKLHRIKKQLTALAQQQATHEF